MKNELNENDKKLIEFCRNTERTTRQVAEHLGIASKNVFVRLKKLEELKLIIVSRRGYGKKTTIRTKEGIKFNDAIKTYLESIKERGGLTFDELMEVLPLDLSNPQTHDNWEAITTLRYLTPKLIEEKMFITEEGLKFLKEHSEKKS